MACNLVYMGRVQSVSKDGALALLGAFDPTWPGGGVTFSNDNLTADISGSKAVGGTVAMSEGKHYFEMSFDAFLSRYGPIMGVVPQGAGSYAEAGAIILWAADGGVPTLYVSGASQGAFGQAITTNDVLGFLVDMDTRVLSFYKNGAPMGNCPSLLTANTYYAYAASPGSAYPVRVTANFGAKTFL